MTSEQVRALRMTNIVRAHAVFLKVEAFLREFENALTLVEMDDGRAVSLVHEAQARVEDSVEVLAQVYGRLLLEEGR